MKLNYFKEAIVFFTTFLLLFILECYFNCTKIDSLNGTAIFLSLLWKVPLIFSIRYIYLVSKNQLTKVDTNKK